MATKAELEAELADLRAQLEKRDERRAGEHDGNDGQIGQQGGDSSPSHALPFELPEGTLQDLANEIEALAKQKPFVTIFAAFLVGYIAGRGR